MPFVLDPNLKQFATESQWKKLKALEEQGSQRAAAKALGCNKSIISSALYSVRQKAAMHGYAPDHGWQHPTPPGYVVKGTSTLRDMKSGEAILQWEKTEADKAAQHEAMKAALAAMCEDIPKAKPVKARGGDVSRNLLNQYTITDYHIGMLAWGEECGEDWDTDIAEDLLVKWFEAAIAQSPRAQVGVLAQLGDFLHWDGMQGGYHTRKRAQA